MVGNRSGILVREGAERENLVRFVVGFCRSGFVGLVFKWFCVYLVVDLVDFAFLESD